LVEKHKAHWLLFSLPSSGDIHPSCHRSVRSSFWKGGRSLASELELEEAMKTSATGRQLPQTSKPTDRGGTRRKNEL
jgi:hypothetical protein